MSDTCSHVNITSRFQLLFNYYIREEKQFINIRTKYNVPASLSYEYPSESEEGQIDRWSFFYYMFTYVLCVLYRTY